MRHRTLRQRQLHPDAAEGQHPQDAVIGDGYARENTEDDRFKDYFGSLPSIVTSSAQNDSGLFETNLRDERYLPFENSGVVSEWQIELPAGFRQFDYDTISDVILHVRYTAREGGGLLKQQATLELQTALNEFIRSEGQQGLAQVFSLRHEFPTEWHRFLNPTSAAVDHNTVTLGLTKDRFPFLFQSRPITVGKIEAFIKVQPNFVATLNLTIAAGNTAPTPTDPPPIDLLTLTSWNGLLRAEKTFSQSPGNWTINAWLDNGGLDPNAIEDFVLVCQYTVG